MLQELASAQPAKWRPKKSFIQLPQRSNTMNVNEYSGAHNKNYEEQSYYGTDEQLEAIRYDE